MILKNLESSTNTIVRENEIDFHIINAHGDIKLESLVNCDAIIFRTDRVSLVKEEIEKIRRSNLPKLYLKPLFVTTKRVYQRLKGSVDGVVEASDLDSVEESLKEILAKTAEIPLTPISNHLSHVDQVLLKSMQYMYSRNINLDAKRTRQAHMGYTYPFVNYLIPDLELHTFLDKVHIATKKNWLTKQLADRVNLCRSCSSSYLHFSETCHKCKSIDIESESLIHHFRCAYIGPESDFKQDEDIFMCPKCDKVLRHIGVDYDKPSEIINCNSCNHQSQQSAIKASCVDCGTDNDLAKLYTKEVVNLKLTAEGINVIKNVDAFSLDNEAELNQLFEYELETQVFDLVRKQEVRKMLGNKLNSYTMNIAFDKEVISHLSKQEKDIFSSEFRKIMGNYLEDVDLMTSRGYTEYDLLLSAKSEHYLNEMTEALQYNINKIINDNFDDPMHNLTINSTRLDKVYLA